MPPTVIRRSIAPYPFIPTSSVAWRPVGVLAACTRPAHRFAATRRGVPLRAAAMPPLLLLGEASGGGPVEAPPDGLPRDQDEVEFERPLLGLGVELGDERPVPRGGDPDVEMGGPPGVPAGRVGLVPVS